MPRASARKAHHPHHGRRRPLIGNHQPVERRLAEPERYFAAQNTVSGASLAGYNQHPLVSRLGRSGEKAGQTRPRAGRRQPVQVNARINRDRAARQPSPRLRVKARVGHRQFFRHRAGWRFCCWLCSVNAFRFGRFSGGRRAGSSVLGARTRRVSTWRARRSAGRVRPAPRRATKARHPRRKAANAFCRQTPPRERPILSGLQSAASSGCLIEHDARKSTNRGCAPATTCSLQRQRR